MNIVDGNEVSVSSESTCKSCTSDKAFAFKRVLVAGLGVSGRGAAEVLRAVGSETVTADENKPDADIHDFSAIDWSKIDAVVTSPVFNPRTPFLQEAASRNIPVMSEVELAWRLRVPSKRTNKPAYWIGITGTNGKTSTTEMTSAMLTACGLNAPAVGNIGKSVSHAALECEHDALCVELSSFQLHFTDSLALDCAAITNIAADHLDWHGGMEAYARDKSKVFNNVQKALVYNAQDERVSKLADCAQVADGCKKIGFTLGEPKDGEIGVKDGWIVDNSGVAGGTKGTLKPIVELRELKHLCEPDDSVYPHLLADALTALALSLGLTGDVDSSVRALREFAPGGHRIQTVATLMSEDENPSHCIRFVDDSKATNAHAACASLASFANNSVVWIAGGLAKGGHFEDLIANQLHVIKAVVVIGIDQRPIVEALHSSAPHIPVTIVSQDGSCAKSYDCVDDLVCENIENTSLVNPDSSFGEAVMRQTVEAAGRYAKPGDVVLLAPACASMDQFVSYADRGNRFAKESQRWVHNHGVQQ